MEKKKKVFARYFHAWQQKQQHFSEDNLMKIDPEKSFS
jgi:hypothetical protein